MVCSNCPKAMILNWCATGIFFEFLFIHLESEWERKRETSICCFTYSGIH